MVSSILLDSGCLPPSSVCSIFGLEPLNFISNVLAAPVLIAPQTPDEGLPNGRTIHLNRGFGDCLRVYAVTPVGARWAMRAILDTVIEANSGSQRSHFYPLEAVAAAALLDPSFYDKIFYTNIIPPSRSIDCL